MAKKSKIVRNQQRKDTVVKYAARRKELKAVLASADASYEDKETAAKKLRKLPRDSSATRIRNRCELTGRARGYYRKFGLCRNMLRERSMRGELPGVTKSSW